MKAEYFYIEVPGETKMTENRKGEYRKACKKKGKKLGVKKNYFMIKFLGG